MTEAQKIRWLTYKKYKAILGKETAKLESFRYIRGKKDNYCIEQKVQEIVDHIDFLVDAADLLLKEERKDVKLLFKSVALKSRFKSLLKVYGE